jgi:hypothetical protein
MLSVDGREHPRAGGYTSTDRTTDATGCPAGLSEMQIAETNRPLSTIPSTGARRRAVFQMISSATNGGWLGVWLGVPAGCARWVCPLGVPAGWVRCVDVWMGRRVLVWGTQVIAPVHHTSGAEDKQGGIGACVCVHARVRACVRACVRV